MNTSLSRYFNLCYLDRHCTALAALTCLTLSLCPCPGMALSSKPPSKASPLLPAAKATHTPSQAPDSNQAQGSKQALDGKSLNSCSMGATLCTMDYRPAHCEVNVSGTIIKAQGSNACAARGKLYGVLCGKGINLSRTQSEAIICRDEPEDQ